MKLNRRRVWFEDSNELLCGRNLRRRDVLAGIEGGVGID